MFTGLIEGLGEILSLQQSDGEGRFYIKPIFHIEKIIDGESISINGVCLSVEEHSENNFLVYASRETMQRTNLKFLKPGMKVNLERALKLGERVGGHLVSGHVDCTARITELKNVGQSIKIHLSFPEEYSAEVVKKGSIALDGISLTINSCKPSFMEVNIIPDSLSRTNIKFWRSGDEINMETDLIGKYVINAVKSIHSSSASKINREFLSQYGFI